MQVLNSDFLKFRISEILIGVLVCIVVCLSLPMVPWVGLICDHAMFLFFN